MEHKYNLIREVNMETSYFLGANTASGFRSLYGGFCRGAGDYLRIVKGGPGTGKSGFMRADELHVIAAPRRTSPSQAFSARIAIM